MRKPRGIRQMVMAVCLAASGCVSPSGTDSTFDRTQLQRRALTCLKAGIGYEANPVVRVEAVEALEQSDDPQRLAWIRSAMLDEHPAVRFAACLSTGRARDTLAESTIARCLEDPDANVRIAALFARHRLGETDQTGYMTTYLLESDEITVRRNAALVLGLLEDKSAVKVLARAMRDPDPGVRHHALEAMARLGNADAKKELSFMANAGVGTEETFALQALAATGDRSYIDTFRYKLANASHTETRLAAARALGLLGSDEGLAAALGALNDASGLRNEPGDSPGDQLLRRRQLAASALGAIGRDDAFPTLEKWLENRSDPRVQVSAAGAILEIDRRSRSKSSAFPVKPVGERR